MAKKRKNKLEIKIIFDTSSLHTPSEVYFVNKNVADTIRDNRRHSDIEVSWYCPDVVRHERQYQMQNKALLLLPSINKLEKLLGHSMNITEKTILHSVEEAVENQLKELGIEKFGLEYSSVDWESLIMNACYREPPFQVGEKEKGFRDALIVETILQLIEQAPKSRTVCRVVVVTDDEQLGAVVKDRCGRIRHVHVLEKMEDVQGLINTLVSKVTEEYVSSIKDKAELCFFDVKKEKGVYFKDNIRNSIIDKYGAALREKPEGATERENQGWFIQAPNFVKKSGQRTYWSTKVRVESEAFKWSEVITIQPQVPGEVAIRPPAAIVGDLNVAVTNEFTGMYAIRGAPDYGSGMYAVRGAPDYGSGMYTNTVEKVKKNVSSGNTIFDVVWSVTVTTSKELRNPKVESIELVGTDWS